MTPLRDLATDLLRVLGYTVVGYAANAARALTAVERLRPHAAMRGRLRRQDRARNYGPRPYLDG